MSGGRDGKGDGDTFVAFRRFVKVRTAPDLNALSYV